MAVGITLSNHGGIYYGDAWNPVYDGVKRGYINRDGKIVIDSKMMQFGQLLPMVHL